MKVKSAVLVLSAGLILFQSVLHAAPPLSGWTDRAAVDLRSYNAWQEVDRLAFENNIKVIRSRIGDDVKLCSVMKADAYGHGIGLLMPSVIKMGIPAIGISGNEEARVARAEGFKGRIIRLRAATLNETQTGMKYNIEESFGNLESARKVSRMAERSGRTVKFHLKLNSGGMSRNGLEMATDQGKQEALELVGLPRLRMVGIYTHPPTEDRKEILKLLAAFRADCAHVIDRAGLDRSKLMLHLGNSYVTFNVPEAHLDMVRPGGALYEPPDNENAAYRDLRRIWQFKTRVASVNAYPAGNTVAYDRTFTVHRDSLLANLPVGFADGFRRLFSNRGTVLIRGHRFPVVGRVTMNTTMVDVTGHPEITPGDEVVLVGRQGGEEIGTDAVLKNSEYSSWEEFSTAVGYQNPKVPSR